MAASFVHFDLRIINPAFGSELTDIVIDLDHLRRLVLRGNTPAAVFFQLKKIFHFLESLGSARIEGNHTTLADYIESKIDGLVSEDDQMREIVNIEKAMEYIEEVISPGSPITHQFIRELHALAVTGLEREGDKTPGAYRTYSVAIASSQHIPPSPESVQGYMDELLNFINQDDPQKYDLLKTALAHHRFCWVHPFGNGNGRVVRLITYAMLIKYGFNVQTGERVLNPTAVFCNDRDIYYDMLGKADSGTDEGLEAWCAYVLSGIRTELQKIDKLTQYDFLKRHILIPTIEYSRERKLITDIEEKILRLAIESGEFKSQDVEKVLPDLTQRQRIYQLGKLNEAKMIQPVRPGARSYTINFTNNYLLRGAIRALTDQGFCPSMD